VNDQFETLKQRVQNKLISELDPKLDLSQADAVRRVIEDLFNNILEQEGIMLPRSEKQRLFEMIAAEILGYGPIEPLLKDETITEVMVNGPKMVWIERQGRLELTGVRFQSNEHVMRVIDRIVSPIGRRCDESSPYVDARLPDGSRVHCIIPPLVLDGPTITIRKFAKNRLTIDDLLAFGTINQQMADFFRACVLSNLNIVISGGTGSGKTTLLNILTSYVPEDQRIVTVEDSAELQLHQTHWVRLETRKPNIEGKGEVTIQDLVVNCLRMRPDRIIVGECRRGEALDMLQAMNTGHDGSMTTCHANNPRECCSRLETMVLMAGVDLPVKAIRDQVAGAIDLIIQQARLKDGTRKVTHITEVQGMEGDTITLQDIFLYQQTGVDSNGKVLGRMEPTGIRPKFIDRMEEAGIHLSASIFGYQGPTLGSYR
jgi:pilus assembly protein CpaF